MKMRIQYFFIYIAVIFCSDAYCMEKEGSEKDFGDPTTEHGDLQMGTPASQTPNEQNLSPRSSYRERKLGYMTQQNELLKVQNTQMKEMVIAMNTLTKQLAINNTSTLLGLLSSEHSDLTKSLFNQNPSDQ